METFKTASVGQGAGKWTNSFSMSFPFAPDFHYLSKADR